MVSTRTSMLAASLVLRKRLGSSSQVHSSSPACETIIQVDLCLFQRLFLFHLNAGRTRPGNRGRGGVCRDLVVVVVGIYLNLCLYNRVSTEHIPRSIRTHLATRQITLSLAIPNGDDASLGGGEKVIEIGDCLGVRRDCVRRY